MPNPPAKTLKRTFEDMMKKDEDANGHASEQDNANSVKNAGDSNILQEYEIVQTFLTSVENLEDSDKNNTVNSESTSPSDTRSESGTTENSGPHLAQQLEPHETQDGLEILNNTKLKIKQKEAEIPCPQFALQLEKDQVLDDFNLINDVKLEKKQQEAEPLCPQFNFQLEQDEILADLAAMEITAK